MESLKMTLNDTTIKYDTVYRVKVHIVTIQYSLYSYGIPWRLYRLGPFTNESCIFSWAFIEMFLSEIKLVYLYDIFKYYSNLSNQLKCILFINLLYYHILAIYSPMYPLTYSHGMLVPVSP